MRKYIYKNVTGFCPIIKDECTVEIKYVYVPVLNSTFEQYKAVSPTCAYSEQCTKSVCPIMAAHPTIKA